MKFPFRERRLVNHFKVGADPEFVFEHPDTGKYIHAGLYFESGGSGLFGADGSRRQMELRAYPSRSVLEVVASLAEALQGIYTYEPRTRKLMWRAAPYYKHDGCGGHVHFGRRRRYSYKGERSALDVMAHHLLSSGVIDYKEHKNRVEMTGYGEFGDVRRQSYGYEYRTLSTWLGSPQQAFLCLTAMKLAVFEPTWATTAHMFHFPTLHDLLKRYATRDNDAALALTMVERVKKLSLPYDIKESWGVRGNKWGPFKLGPPAQATVDELGDAFWRDRPFEGCQASAGGNLLYPNVLHVPGYRSRVNRRFWLRVNELWRQLFARVPYVIVDESPLNVDIEAGDPLIRSVQEAPLIFVGRPWLSLKEWNRLFVDPIDIEITGYDYVRNSWNQEIRRIADSRGTNQIPFIGD